MGRAFDIQRTPVRSIEPPAPPRRGRRSNGGGWLFVLIFLIAIVLATLWEPVTESSTMPAVNPTTTPVHTTVIPSFKPNPPSPSLSLSPTPIPIPTPSLSPSPAPIDKTTIVMSILNASGTAGEARTLRDILLRDGFKTRRIAVTTPQRETTLIVYKSGARPEADFVASFIPDRVLEFEENNDLVGTDTLIIIVGKK